MNTKVLGIIALSLTLCFLLFISIKNYHSISDQKSQFPKTGSENENNKELIEIDKRDIKILCFGDSLTEGMINRGEEFHPYTIILARLFGEQDIKAEIVNSGISGERIESMVERIKQVIQLAGFTHVVILGGTNNLASDSPSEIFEGIQKLHQCAHSRGAQTIAVTLPELGAENISLGLTETRIQVNEMIKSFVQKNSNKVTLLDLCKEIPFHLPTEKDSLWSDFVHFSAKGYDKFGELVFETLTKKKIVKV